jgi:hypothetical protein
MLKSEMLNQLRDDLRKTVKEGKVSLLFCHEAGTPMHGIMVRKIAALEKVVKGVDLLNAGGSADDVCDGIDGVVAAVEEVIALLPSDEHATPFHAERVFLLGLKSKFQQLEDLMTSRQIPMEDDDEDVVMN